MSEKTESVKLMRSPIDTNCGDCKRSLPFGVWVYYNPQSTSAICPECAVKRGWSPKHRVKQLIKNLELREDVKGLQMERKLLLDALMQLKRRIDIHELGARDLDIEKNIIKLMDTVRDYLKQCGTPKEKEAFDKIYDTIRENQELQRKIRDELHNRLFMIRKEEEALKKKREKQKAVIAQ